MNVLLNMIDEHYCSACEEPLMVDEEYMASATRLADLHCPLCGRQYELEIPITGNGYPRLRMTGYGGEWE